NDDAKGAVQRIDGVRSGAGQVEDDTRARPKLSPDANPAYHVVSERLGDILERLDRARVLQVDKDARRSINLFVVKRRFTFKLQRHTHRARKRLAADGLEHHSLPLRLRDDHPRRRQAIELWTCLLDA